MGNIVKTAQCRFCGQMVQIETDKELTQPQAEEQATMTCNCTEAVEYQKEKQRKEKAMMNLTSDAYLFAGDILLNDNAHVATNLTTGSKASGTSAPSKSINEVAKEVINGKWGNGSDRTNRLAAAGYDAKAVQNEVNRILKGNATTPSKSINEVAKEVINGKWGNGSDRTNRLAAAGYDAKAVQNEVNRILR